MASNCQQRARRWRATQDAQRTRSLNVNADIGLDTCRLSTYARPLIDVCYLGTVCKAAASVVEALLVPSACGHVLGHVSLSLCAASWRSCCGRFFSQHVFASLKHATWKPRYHWAYPDDGPDDGCVSLTSSSSLMRHSPRSSFVCDTPHTSTVGSRLCRRMCLSNAVCDRCETQNLTSYDKLHIPNSAQQQFSNDDFAP